MNELMARMEIKLSMSPNRDTVTMELHMDGVPLGHIILEAPDLSDMIGKLALARAALADEIPKDIDPGSRMLATEDPIWRVPSHRFPGWQILALRHPGLGWLSFLFPDHEATGVARELTRTDRPIVDRRPQSIPNPFAPSGPVLNVYLSKHAEDVLRERKIDLEWLSRTLSEPDEIEPDPKDTAVTRHFKAIPEADGRILRVAFVSLPDGVRVVTAFFDRGRRK